MESNTKLDSMKEHARPRQNQRKYHRAVSEDEEDDPPAATSEDALAYARQFAKTPDHHADDDQEGSDDEFPEPDQDYKAEPPHPAATNPACEAGKPERSPRSSPPHASSDSDDDALQEIGVRINELQRHIDKFTRKRHKKRRK